MLLASVGTQSSVAVNSIMILRCLAWAGMHCHDSTDLVLGFLRPEQDVAQVPEQISPKSATSTISYAIISIWFIYIYRYNYICDWYITCYTTIPTIPTIDSLESTGRWQIFIPWPCWRVVLKQSWNLQRRSRNPRKAPLGCCKGDGSCVFVWKLPKNLRWRPSEFHIFVYIYIYDSIEFFQTLWDLAKDGVA